MASIKIAIATPAYGDVFYTPYVQSFFRLLRTFADNKWQVSFLTISYAEVSEARNFLLTHWFDKTDASHLLFIDADMGFDAKLITDMVAFDKPIVGAIYPKRQIDIEKVAERAAKGEPTARAVARAHDFVVRRQSGIAQPRVVKGFMQVDGCGAGLLLIKRVGIADLLSKAPQLSDAGAKKSALAVAGKLDRLIRAFDPLVADGSRLSEDFSFCHRWRTLCDGEVWANIVHPVTHIGLRRFSVSYAVGMPKPHIVVRTKAPPKIETTGRGAVTSGGKPPKPRVRLTTHKTGKPN